MNMKFPINLSICAIILAASTICCSKNNILPVSSSLPGMESLNVSETIPVDEAISYLDQLVEELYGKTKSPSQYSIDVFGGVKTKSRNIELPDSSLYLVNFGEESGYAVLAAQRNIQTKVFCITEAGSITPQDIQNEIIKMDNRRCTSLDNDEDEPFAEYGENFVPAILASSLINQLQCNYEEYSDESITKTNTYVGTPNTLAMMETKWTQNSPFNDFLSNGEPAGCVAIATAQIIEFNALNHGYTSFVEDNNKSFNWDKLFTVCHYTDRYNFSVDSTALAEASNFLQYIGLRKNCNISYGVDGSSGWADGAKRTFKNMGYKSVRKYYGFENQDKNRAIAQLTNGFPMYMDGSGPDGGHAFVLDGLYTRKVYGETGTYLRTENMFHINWGWRGIDDGYYIQGVFNTSQRQDTEVAIDSGDVSHPSSNFTWNYRTITYSL